LYGLVDHRHKLASQVIQVDLVALPEAESLKGLSDVVLPAVEAAVYGALYPPSQQAEQRRYSQGRSDDGEL